jgi:hypothetical protein
MSDDHDYDLLLDFSQLTFDANGLSDPPGWRLTNLDGSPFRLAELERHQAGTFLIWRGTEKVGSGSIEAVHPWN